MVQIVEHGFLERLNGSVTPSSDASFGHLPEQSFHQVEPTSTGGREVNVVPRVPRQPVAHLSYLVRAVVVHYQMHFKAAGKVAFDLIEKPKELLMPVPPIARADRHYGSHIHGRK